MKIQFLGHASFLITTEAGTRIVMDPVDPEAYAGSLDYRPFDETADVVTVSHEHADHGGVGVVKGTPTVIRCGGKSAAKEVEFWGVETCHDEAGGTQRGRNTVFVVSADGLRVAHMGDLGHLLTAEQAAEIGAVDAALIPVGGTFTVDASQAQQVADQVDARIVIPMHYKTEKCEFPIAGVEAFLAGKPNVIRQGGSVLEVEKGTVPEQQQIVVLDHLL